MPADENIWFEFPDKFLGTWGIMARIAPDMNDQNIFLSCPEEEVLFCRLPDVKSVNVTPDSTQRFECFKFSNYICSACITGMPYLINTGKVFINSRINPAMRVRHHSYLHYPDDCF